MKSIDHAFAESETSKCVPNAAFACVRNSFGPKKSLNPAGFLDATRTKYVVLGVRLLIK